MQVYRTKKFAVLDTSAQRSNGLDHDVLEPRIIAPQEQPSYYINENVSDTVCCNLGHELKETLADADDFLCDKCEMGIVCESPLYSCHFCSFDMCEACYKLSSPEQVSPCIIFSAHGDTCFGETSCQYVPHSNKSLHFGHMDNFAGVSSMMRAYFSGSLPTQRVQCHVTYGEERAINGVFYAGARDVMNNLHSSDFVAVIDVTGNSARQVNEANIEAAARGDILGHVVIEKVRDDPLTLHLLSRLPGLCTAKGGYPTTNAATADKRAYPYTYEIWFHCSDVHAFEDETDAYRERQKHVVFLGLPTSGGAVGDMISDGDYNNEAVFCWKQDIDAMSMLIIDFAHVFMETFPE